MTTDRAAEARAEAERRYPSLGHLTQPERAAWKAGARWADANPKPHTITLAKFEDAYTCYVCETCEHEWTERD